MYKLILLLGSGTFVSAGLYSGYEKNGYGRYGVPSIRTWPSEYTPAAYLLRSSPPVATSYSNLYKVSVTPGSSKIAPKPSSLIEPACNNVPHTLPLTYLAYPRPFSFSAPYPDSLGCCYGYGYDYRCGYLYGYGHGYGYGYDYANVDVDVNGDGYKFGYVHPLRYGLPPYVH